ncbi:MAG: lysylphosphatidylglycerol synthase domain-containing protein, partial [Marinobacter sp.]
MKSAGLGQTMLRWSLSAGLLALVWWWIDPEALWPLLRSVSPAWVALALVITVAQVVLSAWRWRYTSAR